MGCQLDKRTDIWSFGCVLYEMLTGRRAFHGETMSDLIAAILEREPDLPHPAGRHAASDPATARTVLREGHSPAHLHEALPRAREHRMTRCRPRPSPSDQFSSKHPAEGAHRRGHWPARFSPSGSVGVTVGWFASRQQAGASAPVFDRVVRLVSTPAHEFSPAISPDGKWVAYLSNARGPTDVWVKFIAGGDPANLTAASAIDVQATDYIGGLDISPDGSEIALIAQGQGQGNTAWVIPAPLGGVARRVLTPTDSSLHWSPDGKRIAFVRTGGPLGDALIVADADGQNDTIVAKQEGAQHIHWPRWSADGRYIYFNHGPQNFNIEPTQIYRVAATGGSIEPVVPTVRRAAFPFLTPDGSGLIYAANPDSVDLSLWWRDLKSGRDVRLTSGVGEYTHPSLSSDGTRLVGTVIDSRQALERVAIAFDRPVTFEPLTDGYSGDIDPVWSPDGSRLVFSTSRTGNRTLWSARGRMEQPAPVTTGEAIDERPGVFA